MGEGSDSQDRTRTLLPDRAGPPGSPTSLSSRPPIPTSAPTGHPNWRPEGSKSTRPSLSGSGTQSQLKKGLGGSGGADPRHCTLMPPVGKMEPTRISQGAADHTYQTCAIQVGNATSCFWENYKAPLKTFLSLKYKYLFSLSLSQSS